MDIINYLTDERCEIKTMKQRDDGSYDIDFNGYFKNVFFRCVSEELIDFSNYLNNNFTKDQIKGLLPHIENIYFLGRREAFDESGY